MTTTRSASPGTTRTTATEGEITFDPLSKGILSGFGGKITELGLDKIGEAVRQFREGEASFTTQPYTERLVHQAGDNELYRFFQQFDIEMEVRPVVRAGVALEAAADAGNMESLHEMRKDIARSHGRETLYQAQCVESGIFREVYDVLADNGVPEDRARTLMADVINDVEDHVLFVRLDRSESAQSDEASHTIADEEPPVYVIAGRGDADKMAQEVAKTTRVRAYRYRQERVRSEKYLHIAYFVPRDLT